MSFILANIDYEEARQFLPEDAVKFLDACEEHFRTYAMNRYHRLIYTKEERKQNYHRLRALNYNCYQARILVCYDFVRLQRIMDGEVQVIFECTGIKNGCRVWKPVRTINLSGDRKLNNFRNIDNGLVHIEKKDQGNGSPVLCNVQSD